MTWFLSTYATNISIRFVDITRHRKHYNIQNTYEWHEKSRSKPMTHTVAIWVQL